MKQITHVKCLIPFTRLMVHHHGYCYSCCASWTRIGNVGRLTSSNSIMEIWNNERMQYIRKAILDNQLWKVCNFKYCPYAIKKGGINLDNLSSDDQQFNQIIDQVRAGATVLCTPPHTVQIANSGKCNLKCIMCQQNDNIMKNDDRLNENLFTKTIAEVLPGISNLSMMVSGEVFFNPYARKFLQSLNTDDYPNLKIELFTNGILFTPKLWNTICHNRYDSIFVSVDAATKDTYEYIRRNGKWEVLRRNLDFISELRGQKVFSTFCINFIVMKSNYREMKDFVNLGLELGCDKILFQKIAGCVDVRENINFTKNKMIFGEIANILTDPVFDRPEVDTTLIDEYRTYSRSKVFFWDDFGTKVKESLFYLPAKTIFSISKYFSFLPHVYEFFKKKKVSVKN